MLQNADVQVWEKATEELVHVIFSKWSLQDSHEWVHRAFVPRIKSHNSTKLSWGSYVQHTAQEKLLKCQEGIGFTRWAHPKLKKKIDWIKNYWLLTNSKSPTCCGLAEGLTLDFYFQRTRNLPIVENPWINSLTMQYNIYSSIIHQPNAVYCTAIQNITHNIK